MTGHLFCSTRCARDHGRHAAWTRVKERLERPVSPGLSVLLLAAAASAPTLLALRTVSTLDRLNQTAPAAPSARAQLTRLARISSVEETLAGARIAGEGPEGAAVFLFAEGRFVAAAPVTEGRFLFEGIRERGPYRVGAMPLSSPIALPPSSLPSRLPSPASFVPPDLTRGPRERREIVVSFDAGSSDRGAAEILDALASRGVKTTIFLTGDFIRRFPRMARRLAADGHEVGNHTATHPHLTTYARDGRQATRPGVDREFLARELFETARLYRETTGAVLAPLWRAPYGEHNAEIRRWAAEAGYWHVGWTGGRVGLDGLDWISDPSSPSYRNGEDLVGRLVARAENGGIILLHLGSDREDPVAPWIPGLFDALAARGFHFARASDFLTSAGYTPDPLASLSVSSGAAASTR